MNFGVYFIFFFRWFELNEKMRWTSEHLGALNDHLSSYSYVDGYQPSVSDTVLHNSLLESQVDTAVYEHLNRWFNHLKSFENEKFGGNPLSVEHILASLEPPTKKVRYCAQVGKSQNALYTVYRLYIFMNWYTKFCKI